MSKSRFVGSVMVDFAGSREEALEFAQEQGGFFPRGLNVPANIRVERRGELPLVSAPFKSSAELRDVSARFTFLGWDRDSQVWPDAVREM